MNRIEKNRQLHQELLNEELYQTNINHRLDFIIKQLELIIKLFEIESRREITRKKFDDMFDDPIKQLEDLFNIKGNK